MLLKDCDSREYDVLVLEVLAQNATLSTQERQQVLRMLRGVRAHQERRRSLARFLNTLFESRDDWVVLHDLRLEGDDGVIELDHVLINRLMQFWVLDASCFDLPLTISPFGELSAHQGPSVEQGASVGQGSLEDIGEVVQSGDELRLTPSPLLALKEQQQCFRRWLESSGLLPSRLGMVLQPQLTHRLVIAAEEQVSRPPEDILDSRALVDLRGLSEECLNLGSGAASVARMRDFTHRIDPRRLRRLGRAILAQHGPSRVDWASRLGLSEHVTVAIHPDEQTAYAWVPPQDPSASPSVAPVRDDAIPTSSGNDAPQVTPHEEGPTPSETRRATPPKAISSSFQTLMSGMTQTMPSSTCHGLQAQDWQPSVSDVRLQGVSSSGAKASDVSHGHRGMGSGHDEMQYLQPRCDECRRWLSKASVALCRSEGQRELLGDRMLCQRCRASD
jgi:hypothetical protein